MKTRVRKQPVDSYVVLYGVPWDTYVAITDALGEYHLRHTYDRGTLEMRSPLYGVSWDDYERFLTAVGDHNLRHTYDKGTLEMMSPLKVHELEKKLLARMIERMAEELDMDIQSVGSTTFRHAAAEQGLQPDESYYFAHEPLVRCSDKYDPRSDPPPDLVVEVDVTSSVLPRLPLYAALRVPELWQYDAQRLAFLGLEKDGKYKRLRTSVVFPRLRPQDLLRFLDMRHEKKEKEILRAFLAWFREHYVKEAK
ncbi:MAG: Uma2 family endonuclease [Planctomycetia bacterium]|nr:Uma2 family endonuclease [Planctomycetia bacterium]